MAEYNDKLTAEQISDRFKAIRDELNTLEVEAKALQSNPVKYLKNHKLVKRIMCLIDVTRNRVSGMREATALSLIGYRTTRVDQVLRYLETRNLDEIRELIKTSKA